MAGTFPAIFSTLIYGPVSDRKGRLPIMRLPPLGCLIDVSIALATIYLELPLYFMAIGKIYVNFSNSLLINSINY